MSFESVYRSRDGVREIEKLVSFLGTLIIKNEYEAQLLETDDSISNFYLYEAAYTGIDTIVDYTAYLALYENKVTVSDILKKPPYNYTDDSIIDYLVNTPTDILQLDSNSSYVKTLLVVCRNERVNNYQENNFYYRQFLGKPNSEADRILVMNFDAPDPNDPSSYIYLDQINQTDYPESYTFYILRRNIDLYIARYPTLGYLRFIDTSNTPYYVRKLPNYSIIYKDVRVLTTIEQSYFIKAYNKARSQVIMDYIDGFDSRYPIYNVSVICNLLYFTIINYSNTYLEKYSLNEFSEENINDILDSNGFSKLKNISDLEMKRRIVLNLDDLRSTKGTETVLQLILDKILENNNNSNEVKRFYLEKQYPDKSFNNDFAINIDTSKTLEHSISLVFKEVPYATQAKLSDTEDIYHDYDEFVANDNYWGGIDANDSQTTKELKKESLKRELLSIDFNSILARYITLTRSIDILTVQRETKDLLYMLLARVMEGTMDEFYDNKITFSDFECTAAGLFGAICWLQQMKFIGNDINADPIIKNNCLMNATSVFRKYGDLSKDAEAKMFEIVDGEVIPKKPSEGYKFNTVDVFDITPNFFNQNIVELLKDDTDLKIETVTIDDILTYSDVKTNIDNPNPNGIRKEKFEDFIIRYRYYDDNGTFLGDVRSDTLFSDLITDYEKQSTPLFKIINKKMADSYDYREYQAWKYVMQMNRTNNSIEDIFAGYDKFTDFITAYESSGLINWLYENNLVDESVDPNSNDPNIRLAILCDLMDVLMGYFETWVSNNISDRVFTESGSNDVSYVRDIKLLFDEFISVYSELYNVKYNMEIEGDHVFQLGMYYNRLFTLIRSEFSEITEMLHRIIAMITINIEHDLEMDESLLVIIKYIFEEAINGELIRDGDDIHVIPMLHELSILLKKKFNEVVLVKHELTKLITQFYNEKVIMKDSLYINGYRLVDGILYYNDTIAYGYHLYNGDLYKDGELNEGYVLFKQ